MLTESQQVALEKLRKGGKLTRNEYYRIATKKRKCCRRGKSENLVTQASIPPQILRGVRRNSFCCGRSLNLCLFAFLGGLGFLSGKTAAV